MKKYLPIFLILITSWLTSCSAFIEKIDKNDVSKEGAEKKFSLIFSHNISGETHPCGCRNFPLGGLPQVAGLFAEIGKDSEILYVDTGDTLFASSAIPSSMKDSLSFNATHLALGLEQAGLKYFVPGDQDFALGIDFLKGIANSRSFDFLISNLKDPTLIKHKKFAEIDRGKTKIFLLGLVDPDVMYGPHGNYFNRPAEVFNSLILELEAAGYQKKNQYHRLIVLSHAGIDPDKALAKEFPYIDWIIGAHSQSFLRYSDDIENVKIVQTLSKNHYMGDIKIDLNSKKQTDTYALHEVRDELEQKLVPNPMTSFIYDHKNKMNEIQLKEQAAMGMGDFVKDSTHKNVPKFKTATSCIECHKPQTEFWQATPHSIAYTTLIKANEANNLSCIGCHSLGLNDPKGYNRAQDLVSLKNKTNLKKYWDEVKKLTPHETEVRALPKEDIKKISVEWAKLDKKMGVKQNFSNVQCLNCHGVSDTHPKVHAEDKVLTQNEKVFNIKNKCLSCHTPDQSPEWYENGLKVNAQFEDAYKKVSCPIN